MTSLFEVLGRKTAMLELVAKKSSPQVLFVGGVAGMVGSTVLACRATLKLEEVLHASQRDLQVAKAVNGEHKEQYTDQDLKQDTAIIYVRSVARVAKLYAPAVILGSVSIAALTKSHNILNERNAALMAAYSALDKGFREYRQRVVDKYGEDQDQQFRYETETVVEGNKNGKKKTITRVNIDGNPSIYARFFDPLCPDWSKEPEYNAIFLKCQQNYVNDLLHARGHVFLNEVYERLGIPHSKAGAVVGWLRGPEGDGYIDFGVFVPDAGDRVRDFVNGREGSILLDFNVDGLIYDKIESTKEAIAWQQD